MEAEHFTAMAAIWDQQAESMDAAMGAHSAAARLALALQPGERVVDLGCGPGMSAVALGAEAGPDGWVAAVDISAEMAAAAARRMAAAGVHGAAFTADAGTADLVAEAGRGVAFDAVHSRFGLMFFPDPAAAFVNIHRALRPGGRLAASVWQHLTDNPWLELTTATATQILGVDRPPLAAADAPGPFSMADREADERLLAAAGFVDVVIEAVNSPFIFAGDGYAAAERVLGAGPLGAAFAGADPARRHDVVTGVVAALERHRGPAGLEVPAASWLISARRA